MPTEPERWLLAAADADVAADLEAVYRGVADAITERGPACWASGRCCNFEATGHRLYVTGLEAAYALLHFSSAPARAPERAGLALPVLNADARAPGDPGAGPLTHATLDEAIERGGCPFQAGHLCGARAVRPLGCRVYFCDHSAQEWQRALTERALREIRAIHDRREIPYRYGEWRALLRDALEARR